MLLVSTKQLDNSWHLKHHDRPELTGAIARDKEEEVLEFLVAAGLDQGDPLSPAAYAATLPLGTLQHMSLQSQPEAQTKRPVSGCLSTRDDLTLAVLSAAARPPRQLAEAAMSDVVLWLNMSKCMVSTPAREVAPGMVDAWEQGARHDGLLIKGMPYSVDNATLDTDAGVIGTVLPVGDQKFQADFANSMRDKIVAALEPIEQPTARAEAGQPARQSANVLLHHFVPANVPPPTTNHAKPASHSGHTCDSQYCTHQQFHAGRAERRQRTNPALADREVGLKRPAWMVEGTRQAGRTARAKLQRWAAVPQL